MADFRRVDRVAQSLDVGIVEGAVDGVRMAVFAAVGEAIGGRVAPAGRSLIDQFGD